MYFSRVLPITLLLTLSINDAFSQATSDQVSAAKNQIDLLTYQATSSLIVQQKEAEARKAIAEANKAEVAAQIPATEAKPLAGKVDTEKFGAAGQAKAVDLAIELAADVCTVLNSKSPQRVAVYDAATFQGVANARMLDEGIRKIKEDLIVQNSALLPFLKPVPPSEKKETMSLTAIAAVGGAIKVAADVAALFKTNTTYAATSYGDGTRNLFISALAKSCPDKFAGLSNGYFGELDTQSYTKLSQSVRELAKARAMLGETNSALSKQAETEKGESKQTFMKVTGQAASLLKTADTFIESLKIGDGSDKSPLYNAARYLAYQDRIKGANILEFDLRLEGMTIMRENLFTGQKLRLTAMAILWIRIYDEKGILLVSDVKRKLPKPIEVEIKGDDTQKDFWN